MQIPDKVIRIGGVEDVRPPAIDDEGESDDEFDDDEGRVLFNSDAINRMIEMNVLNKSLYDYSLNSGPLGNKCLLVALYVGYLRLTQPNNFNRIISKGKNWMSDGVSRRLEGVVKDLGKAKDRGGIGKKLYICKIC